MTGLWAPFWIVEFWELVVVSPYSITPLNTSHLMGVSGALPGVFFELMSFYVHPSVKPFGPFSDDIDPFPPPLRFFSDYPLSPFVRLRFRGRISAIACCGQLPSFPPHGNRVSPLSPGQSAFLPKFWRRFLWRGL